MNIVTSHVGTDFDALASMILVTKLYRDTTAVFSGSVDRRVQEFCNLFADSFSVARSREIDRDEVDTLIVVDCADARRLGAFQELAASGRVRVHVFDHHAPDEVDEELRGMSPEVYAFEPVGATATMLLDRLPWQTASSATRQRSARWRSMRRQAASSTPIPRCGTSSGSQSSSDEGRTSTWCPRT